MAAYRLGDHLLVDPFVGFFLATPIDDLVREGSAVDALAEIFKVQGCLDCRKSRSGDEILSKILASITSALGSEANEFFQLACHQLEEMKPPPLWPMAEAEAVNYLQERCLQCDECCGPLARAAEAAGLRRVSMD